MSAPSVDVAVTRRAVRSGVLGWVSTHRAIAAAGAVWVLFAANFNLFSLSYVPDALRPYYFLQRLVGDRHGAADAYEFGLAFAWAPFYGLGKLVVLGGVHAIGGKPALPGVVALSASVFVLAAGAALVPVLSGLRLPHPALVLLCAVFGTPLFFYGTFNPGHTHALEALLLAAVVTLLFLYFRAASPSPWLAAAMGILLSASMTVRYFSGAWAVALVLGLIWYRRWRDAALVAATPIAGLALAALVAYETAGDVFQGAGRPGQGGVGAAANVLVFAPLNPLRMLFTDHRGLFVWSPVTILAVLGFVRLLRRRPSERPFLAICGWIAIATVLSYAFSPYWDCGVGCYNQRYLTSLFPFVALGLGGLLEWRPGPVRVAAIVATVWTLCLGLYVGLGFGDLQRGASDLPSALLQGRVTPGLIAYNVYRVSNFSFVIPNPYR